MTKCELKPNAIAFIRLAKQILGEDVSIITRADIKVIMDSDSSIKWPSWLTADKKLRAGRGQFTLPKVDGTFENAGVAIKGKKTKDVPAVDPNKVLVRRIVPEINEENSTDVNLLSNEIKSLIPKQNPIFVKWGFCSDIATVLKSQRFYPVFITGLSGNGKTMMVEQVCAELKRPMYRANITAETDEDDLLGGFRLENGATVWHDGPVIEAMQTGSILLLDEIDLGTEKLMCLQPILEGKGVYIKKINKFIEPAKGFNIVATANTKGKGSDSGQFIGTNVMNEAFLERFSITLEQPYPTKATEKKILTNSLSVDMDVCEKEADFVEKLVTWGAAIRKLYFDGGIDEIITTRRLVHICSAYTIFGENRTKAITLAIARFDDDVKSQLMSFYEKIDESIEEEKRLANAPKVADKVADVETPTATTSVSCPF